jgi:hypothetical protein
MAEMPQPGETASGEGMPALAADLTAAAGAEEGSLEAMRSALASATAAGQSEPIVAGPGGGDLAALLGGEQTAPGEGQAGFAAPQAEGGEEPLVLRRDLPLQPPTGPGALPEWVVGRAGEVVGEATGALGQRVAVEAFASLPTTSLRRASASSPFLIVAGPAPVWDSQGKGSLGPCSVWISASLFAAGAPAPGWVGLKVASGAISGAAPTLGPSVLIVPDAATLRVELKLSPMAPAGGAGPGQDARDADVRAPDRVVFTLAPAGGRVAELGEALLTAYGTTVRMRHAGRGPAFVPVLSSIVFPLDPDSGEWSPGASASSLAALGGGGRLSEAGWSLPVTRAQPSTLGAAEGPGNLTLRVDGLTLGFAKQARPVPMGMAWLVAQPGSLMLLADAAVGTGVGGGVTLYPDPDGGRGVGGRAEFRFADAFALRYMVSGAGTEGIGAGVALEAFLDRPLAATGQRIPLVDPTGIFFLTQSSTGTTLLLQSVAEGVMAMTQGLTVLLDNALLSLDAPTQFAIRASVSDDGPGFTAPQGAAAIVFPLNGILPTLPDPYVSTFTPSPEGTTGLADRSEDAERVQTVVARLDWDAAAGPAEPSLTFKQPTPTASAPASPEEVAADAMEALGDVAVPDRRADAPVPDRELLQGLILGLANAAAALPGLIALLDVSSNADQFGVRLGVPVAPSGGAAMLDPPKSRPVVDGMGLLAPAHIVSVMTLPAVQWEPVIGSDASGPFSPMEFPNSGGETEITSRSVRLVPFAPTPALTQMIDDYDDASASEGAVAFVTFPFGIRAVALLNPPRGSGAAAELDLHQPRFAEAQLVGAKQVRAIAVRNPLGPASGRASLSGAAVQLSNGMSSGLSPIHPLTSFFNEDFGPGGNRPQVPVDRFELSGYGESLFSEWKDDSGGSITQVRFDVLNGRTAVEVVQARSILYPYGVRVIRTIKMLRDNAGRVRRTDSGWQAQTDGRYAWLRPDVKTHPGVVRGVTRVENIRDTNHTWKTAAGTQLMAVRFDCLVDLEGTVAGAGAEGAPSRGQLGFVQASSNPTQGLTPLEFAELIRANGPLGGSVDAIVEVGGGGLRSRVTRVGVGVTDGLTGPEFAMATWGSPVLPAGGSWSVVRRAMADPAPGPVDPALGVPLIRAGHAGSPPNPAAPYRFADPADLAKPNSPAADYALLHATDTQRVLFPRPKVELSGARAGQLSSSQPPVLADPFLMATAVGPFPPVATAIGFPDADYGLRPTPGGDLALDLVHNDFQVGGGDRTIHAAGGTTFSVRYRDERGDPAVVHLELNSAKPVPWAFRLGGVELCFTTSMMGEVIRFLGTVEASANRPGRFSGATIHFGDALEAVEFLTDFLGTKRLADMPLGSRNHSSLKIAEKIPIVGAPGQPEKIDLGVVKLVDADVTVGIEVDLAKGETAVGFELAAIITGRTPYDPLVGAGQLKFEIQSDSSGNAFKLTLGLGVGVEGDIGPFEAKAFFFENAYVVVGTNQVGFGMGLELKGEIDLKVISAEIDVEASAMAIEATCPAGSTQWLVAQLTIAVDITIAWVIDIEFDYKMQVETNLNDGPCPVPV